MRFLGLELRNPFRRANTAQVQPDQQIPPHTFVATIKSIIPETYNNKPVYMMRLEADGVNHAIAAMLPQVFQDSYPETAFGDLKENDLIQVAVIDAVIYGGSVPVSVLGYIQKCPPGTEPENKHPVMLGYKSYPGF